jgi:KaiC/GvpD/RAD55 family RecA-like ATPase
MEFTTEESPQTVLEAIEEFKADCNSDLEIIPDLDKKCIILEDKSRNNLKLKLKMYKNKVGE